MNPMLPLAITAAAFAAIVAFTRKKSGPTPDPIGVAPVLMQGAAGSRQYTLRKVGPGYAWDVKGDKEGTGSHSSSGSAVMDMFEFLYTGNQADLITGHVAVSPSTDGLAGSFTITKETPLHWNWIVSKPAPEQAAAHGSGESSSRGAATLSALQTIEEYTDWLSGIPQPQGGALGPTDPGAGEDTELPPITQHHGVLIGPVSVTAYDLPMWLEYARPIIEDEINEWLTGVALPVTTFAEGETPTDVAVRIHTALGLHDLGPAVKFTGRTHAQVLAAMTKPLQQWTAKKYLELDGIQHVIAAAAIGAKLTTFGKKAIVKGRPTVAIRRTAIRAEWYVWAPGNRRGVQFATHKGDASTLMKAWKQAVEASAGPGDILGPGQVDSPTPGIPPTCDGEIKISSVSRNLPSSTFEDGWERDIKLWSPWSNKCESYLLRLGACMIPSGGGSFGKLDYYTEGLGQGDAPHKGDADEISFGIERHPAYDDAMDWWLFQTPLAWKRQFLLELRYVDGQLTIDESKQIEDGAIDPCPNAARRWPGYGDDHYVVRTFDKKLGQNPTSDTRNWNAQPDFSLFIDGKNLFAKVRYKGLPFFVSHAPQFKVFGVDPTKKNGYTISFKIQAIGDQS